MNTDDFRYMWRGKQIKSLAHHERDLLTSIEQHGPGDTNALLLLHGFSSSPAVYRELLPVLPPYDAIICPTLPGHGESIQAFSTIKASDWLRTAENACEKLVKNYQKVDVMGLSLGGLLACRLSEIFPLHHLYLLAPALDLHLNIKRSLQLARVLQWLGFQYLRNRAGNLCSELYSELAYRQLPITAIIEILTLIQEFQFTPPSCAIDLFLGCFDQVVDSTRVASRFVKLPQCNIHWLPKSAHVLPLDSDLKSIAACVHEQFQKTLSVA